MKFELLPPLTRMTITQAFGENAVSFYKMLGLIGHNGIDYRARIGTPIYACHSGIVVTSRTDSGGGKCIEIITSKTDSGYKTIYYHLSKLLVNKGDKIVVGQLIGKTGNTGKYTTGPHLHFGLKITIDGRTRNRDNGFRGCVNPEAYFVKGYDKSRAHHRYGRKRNWLAEYQMRFAPCKIKNRWANAGRYIHGLSRKLFYSLPLSGEKINALVYGGWDLNSVIDPAMQQIWRWNKKDEYSRLLHKLK